MAWPIYLYAPNIVGYVRVGLCMWAFRPACCFEAKGWFSACYLASFYCDYLDGRFAVWFDQKSTFGAVLDMLTDRMSTAGLLMLLSHLYPAYFGFFLLLLALDVTSHWMQMYSSFLLGLGSHKSVTSRDGWLVRQYYGSRAFMGYCCVGAEVLYLALYWLHEPALRHTSTVEVGVGVAEMILYLAIPGWAVKQVVNVVQLKSGADICVNYDLEKEKPKST